MTPQLPSGTVTFLFTDIVGSTPLWELEPEHMRPALDRHHAILRDAIEAQGGHVFKIIGDAFQAAFALPTQAVAAAIASQRALAAEVWPTSIPIDVRMGLHAGPAIAEESDYATTHTLNRVARIMAAGSGGQILLSVEVADLLRGYLSPGVTLRDLGWHHMKGMSQLEHLFQVVAPDLPADFPPLKSSETRPNNLPVQLTSFVGREPEIAEVKRMLAETRILTLTGSGGTGKTRLALQVAAEVLDAFPDGVWFVELAPLSDPTLVPQTVASVWGVHDQPGRPITATLTDYLRDKAPLLVLDNCEHVIDACAQLAIALVRACPHLKILPSSREALGVAGETAYRVPSLSLPDRHQPLTVETALRYEAVRLFVERAQAAQPRFALTAHNIPAVGQICQRLDGIPLAIELAAARLKLMTAEQIAVRLDDRFRLLTGGSRTALPRQQTLRALIDWSYDLLPEPERRALRRLSVFAGGWSFEAAEAVIGPEALDLLAHLVDKSLVVAEELEEGGETRYRMLETIRQYARDKLLESGESSTARDLHLDHYVHLAAEAEPHLESHDMLYWLGRMEPDHDNFRAALEWALEHDPDVALELASSLTFFWQRRGYQIEARAWLRECLIRSEALSSTDEAVNQRRLADRSKALCAAGTLAFAMGELHVARAVLEQSADLARQVGDYRMLARALGLLGFVMIWLGDTEASDAVIDEGLRIARATGDKRTLANMRSVQALQASVLRGDSAAADAYGEEAVRLTRDLDDPWLAAITITGQGRLNAAKGNYAGARVHFEESERLFQQQGDLRMVNAMQSERAHIERQQGHYTAAVALYSRTLPRWQEYSAGAPVAAVAHQLECFAFIATAQSQAGRAARLLSAAEALRERINTPMTAFERAEYDRNVAAVRAQMGDEAFAAAWAEGQALTMEEAIAFALEAGANESP